MRCIVCKKLIPDTRGGYEWHMKRRHPGEPIRDRRVLARGKVVGERWRGEPDEYAEV